MSKDVTEKIARALVICHLNLNTLYIKMYLLGSFCKLSTLDKVIYKTNPHILIKDMCIVVNIFPFIKPMHYNNIINALQWSSLTC